MRLALLPSRSYSRRPAMTDVLQLADALFRPRAVALVGASGDPQKNTGRPQRFLRQHGFAGTVYPINPGRERCREFAPAKSVADAPGPVDHALIMVPAAKVPAAHRGLRARRRARWRPCTATASPTWAPPEGRARQDALVELARAVGVRLVGPNSMGVMNFNAGLTLSVNAILEMPAITRRQRLGVVSQSGSILGSLLSRGTARGFGFSKMVSIGNESDISVGEVMDMLVDDPETATIVLFLESLRGAEGIACAARRAHAAGKAVVAYKLGRSQLWAGPGGHPFWRHDRRVCGGRRLLPRQRHRARGHVRDPARDPAAAARGPRERAKRVSVMTTTGGGAATVVDRLGALGVETVPASDELSARLAAEGIAVAGKAIVDLTMAGARREVFGAALQAMLDDDASEAVVVVVGSSGQFHPHLTVEPIAAAHARGKPLAVYIVPDAPASLALLAEAGIAAFRTPEGCADAVACMLAWRGPLPEPGEMTLDDDAASASSPTAPPMASTRRGRRRCLPPWVFPLRRSR